MQEKFGNSRIETAFKIIKEIIYCWFTHYLKDPDREQMPGILARIKKARTDLFLPVQGENCSIMLSFNEDNITLAICANEKSLEGKLRLFEKVFIRYKAKPDNSHYDMVTAQLYKTMLAFIFNL